MLEDLAVHSGRFGISRRLLFVVVGVRLVLIMSAALSQAHSRVIRPNGTVAVTGVRVRSGGRRVPLRRTGSELGRTGEDGPHAVPCMIHTDIQRVVTPSPAVCSQAGDTRVVRSVGSVEPVSLAIFISRMQRTSCAHRR
jgi:hypothetical protein